MTFKRILKHIRDKNLQLLDDEELGMIFKNTPLSPQNSILNSGTEPVIRSQELEEMLVAVNK